MEVRSIKMLRKAKKKSCNVGILLFLILCVFVNSYKIVIAKQIDQVNDFEQRYQKEIIHVQQKYEKLLYGVLSGDEIPQPYHVNSNANGFYDDFTKYIEQNLEIPIEKVIFSDKADAISKLRSNEIQVVFGLFEEMENENLSYLNKYNKNELVIIIRDDNIEVNTKTIPYLYFGTEENTMKPLRGSLYENHTIIFNSFSDTINALKKDNVDCAIIKKSDIEEAKKMLGDTTVISTGINVGELAALNSKNKYLNLLLEKLLSRYQEEYKQIANQEIADKNSNLYIEYWKEWKALIILGSIAIVAVCILIRILWQKSKWKKRYTRVVESLKKDNNLEFMVFFLKTKRIHSSNGFATLLRGNPIRKKKLKVETLSEIMCYDYDFHYKRILDGSETKVERTYEIFSDNVKYQFYEMILKEKKELLILTKQIKSDDIIGGTKALF